MGTGPTYQKSNLSKPCFTPDEQAIIQLNPSTLSLKSRWALPKTQAGFDLDFGATPTLFSATTANGVSEPLVGAENKNGVYYAFDRQDLSAGPVWVYQAETTAVLNGTPCGTSTRSLRRPRPGRELPCWWRAWARADHTASARWPP